ncbi:MAG: hypothetical protein LBJ73_02100 [Rickettsiales bacterium]|jgi:hypothetical protein|nr:hypothetical protein [Rickettsiales bacterium]
MKKSTIVLLAWAFAIQGAFADISGSDTTGDYTISGFSSTSPATDYSNGIHTIQNTSDGKYSTAGTYSTYKGETVYSYSGYTIPSDLTGYYLQDVCASASETTSYAETSCSITTNNSSSILNSGETRCLCRLKRKSDNVSAAGWVFDYSYGPAADCADYCASYCAINAYSDSVFRSALLAAFE